MVEGRISVITLSYNNLEYYQECLESITKQVYDNIELVLCDDCSDDFEKYEDKIRQFLNTNTGNVKQYIIHHNKNNLGVVSNYRQALHMATGEYIFYLAIDDIFYDENVLLDVVKYFKDTGLQIFTGFRETIHEDGKKQIQPSSYEAELLKNRSVEEILKRDIRVPMIAGACTPFKKQLIETHGFVEKKYKHLEDWPRYLQLLEAKIPIGFIDRCLIKYRAGGITYKPENPDIIKDFRQLLHKYMNLPYSNVLSAMKEKEHIIAWGSSGGFLSWHEKWEKMVDRKIDIIVDKNSEKWGTVVDGITVYAPEKIMEFSKNDRYVLVFSESYYCEIADQLQEMGLEEGKEFDIVSEIRVVAGIKNAD